MNATRITTVFVPEQPDLSQEDQLLAIASEAIAQEPEEFRGVQPRLASHMRDSQSPESGIVYLYDEGFGLAGRMRLERQFTDALHWHVDVSVAWSQ